MKVLNVKIMGIKLLSHVNARKLSQDDDIPFFDLTRRIIVGVSIGLDRHPQT
jgi:hypothetical protein